MKTNRNNGGFTLVELMVTILTGSVITLAAVTVLLLGLRIHHQSTETVQNQNTTRILLSALEDMASEGTIKKIVYTDNDWAIEGENGILFYYDSDSQTVFTGGTKDNNGKISGGTSLFEGVVSSFVTKDENGLLTFAIETKDGSYASSVRCRMDEEIPEGTEAGDPSSGAGDTYDGLISDGKFSGDVESILNKEARAAFLNVLAGQYQMKAGGANDGVILNNNGTSTGQYYSQWYSSNWSKDTPWCACFVSWALSEGSVSQYVKHPEGRYRWYANVDRFAEYFQNETDGASWIKRADSNADNILPGDLIFFDWDLDGDIQHVGVVLAVTGGNVYTIEGNSGDRVAVRKYTLEDKRIFGYGVLNWDETE